jgi:hypothetical protein
MYDRVMTQIWMLLPVEKRRHLAHVFSVQKTGISEIRDSDVISDGHTNDDLSVITAEAMEAYVGSSETFPRLWELTIAKCHSELNPPIGIIVSPGTKNEEVIDGTFTENGDGTSTLTAKPNARKKAGK